MSGEAEEGCTMPFMDPQASMYGGNGSDHPFSVQFLLTLPIDIDKYKSHVCNNVAVLNDRFKIISKPTFDPEECGALLRDYISDLCTRPAIHIIP